MMNIISWGIRLCLLSFLFLLLPAYAVDEQPPVVVTEQGLHVVQEARQVQPLRVMGYRADKESVEGQTIDGYKITTTGDPQEKIFAQRLGKVVTAEANETGHKYQSACLLSPVVAYQFHGEAETVDVLVCFHCYEMLIVEHDPSGKIIHEASTGFGDPSQVELIRLAKLAFPNDAELQSLKAKHSD